MIKVKVRMNQEEIGRLIQGNGVEKVGRRRKSRRKRKGEEEEEEGRGGEGVSKN